MDLSVVESSKLFQVTSNYLALWHFSFSSIKFVFTDVDLKAFRTETTLCVPDPLFGHTETHVLLAPPDVPVQRILLSSLANQGLRNGGGVQFEVWCR